MALSAATNATEINDGKLYPDLDRIRNVSVVVAREVIKQAQSQKLDREEEIRGMGDEELDQYIKSKMYDPFAPVELLDIGSGGRPAEKSVL